MMKAQNLIDEVMSLFSGAPVAPPMPTTKPGVAPAKPAPRPGTKPWKIPTIKPGEETRPKAKKKEEEA
jgi:hypothetical protein